MCFQSFQLLLCHRNMSQFSQYLNTKVCCFYYVSECNNTQHSRRLQVVLLGKKGALCQNAQQTSPLRFFLVPVFVWCADRKLGLGCLFVAFSLGGMWKKDEVSEVFTKEALGISLRQYCIRYSMLTEFKWSDLCAWLSVCSTRTKKRRLLCDQTAQNSIHLLWIV